MKKVSFRVRNFDTEQFLTYNIDNDADLDEELLDFLEDEEPQGIVPVIFDDEDEECDTFSYNITDKIHLTELSNQEITAEMVLKVTRGMACALIDMAEYRVPLSYLVFHRNYIYIDSDYKVEFICIPLEEMQEDVEMDSFFRNFIASLRFESSENGDYVAKLLSFINNSALFNLRGLVNLVEGLMDDLGIEIPEDESNEIYADYQEVEEASAVDIVDALDDDDDEPVVEAQAVVEEAISEEVIDEEPEATEEEEVVEETDVVEEDAKATIDRLKEQVLNSAVEETPEEIVAEEEASEEEIAEEPEEADAESVATEEEVEEETEEPEEEIVEEVVPEKKKKPAFKTKDTSSVTGMVIEDDFEEFLAEREREENEVHREESSIKIKKNIKVSRASIVKNSEDEIKAAVEAEEDIVEEASAEEEVGSTSILSQTLNGATGLLKGNTAVPKVNPYLIRVNTDERIMITKQTFKLGKASMGVDYTIKGNGAISRVHAIITAKDDVYYVKDNKSTNHTYVNGKLVDDGQNEILTHDSKIMLGDEEFVFKMQ